MDQSKALQKLLEAADLTRMIEDIVDSSRTGNIESSLSGLKITLRTVRESILESQGVLAKDLVSRARAAVAANSAQPKANPQAALNSSNPVVNGPNASRNASPEIRSAQLGQRSLRNSIEQARE